MSSYGQWNTIILMNKLEDNLQRFIESSSWIFARTYADTWPHWYLVEEQVDDVQFNELATFIDMNGYKEYFYTKQMTFFNHGKYTYWHMENIINRCLLADTYHRRLMDNRLPHD